VSRVRPDIQTTAGSSELPPSRERSARMAKIRQKHTGPEIKVRSLLHRMGLRFRLHRRELPGSPDIVLPRLSTAIFVHGCFWHRHPGCRLASTPKTRTQFWDDKFAANVARDRTAIRALKALGWRVLVVWECETRNLSALSNRLNIVLRDSTLRP